MLAVDGVLQVADGRQMAARQPELDEADGAQDARMTAEGGDLDAWDEQQAVEVRLQFAQRMVVRDGVVVGDGDEVDAVGRGGLDGLVDGPWRAGARLALDRAVRVAGVHMQVAAIPPGADLERLRRESGDR